MAKYTIGFTNEFNKKNIELTDGVVCGVYKFIPMFNNASTAYVLRILRGRSPTFEFLFSTKMSSVTSPLIGKGVG